MKILLDPGHGWKDTGAVSEKILEKNINLIVAKKVHDILKYKGFDVKMSRTTDTFVSLDDRCKIANLWQADMFISIHHNSGGGIGFEIIHSIYNGKGLDLANYISKEFINIGQKLRRIYSKKNPSTGKDYFAIIRGTKMPAIITEYAFIDSSDVLNIDSTDKLHRQANAIATGICRFINR